ncbi:mitochondrial ribosomal protein [Niveomyces insectorum RCEF 264]|uniref:Mitochondrial ribosomal protein n=1 Tax=Niveomyces insectorum RCEF 264 TaxID=1081102 RepID=A0A167Y830_9HYPO|nr:mitochondrial ribosomal protein [Niveomyces insectorum RCEF 264]
MRAAAAPRALRPLTCCLQTTTRRACVRRWASSTTTEAGAGAGVRGGGAVALPPIRFQAIPTKEGRIRTAFAVYAPSPPPPAAQPAASSTSSEPTTTATTSTSTSTPPTKTAKVDVLRAYHAQQIARMDPTGARTHLFSRNNPDSAKPGDVLLVTPRRTGVEPFAGVCLGLRRSGIETAILLRGQLAKTGVERWFKIYSRAVAAIDIVQRRPKRARRAKLTYMRQPKHDMGSVEDLVKAWRRSRNVLRTRGGDQSSAAGGGGKKAARK